MKSITDFVAAFYRSAKALQFYRLEHPRTEDAVRDLERATADLLGLRPSVALIAAKGVLLVEGQQVVGSDPQIRWLAVELEAREIRGVVLMQGIRRAELIELATLLSVRPQQVQASGGAESLLTSAGVTNIRISRTRYEAVTEGEEVVWSGHGPNEGLEGPEATDALAGLLQQYLLAQGTGDGEGGGSGSGTGGTGESGTGDGDGAGEGSGGSGGRALEDALLAALLGNDQPEPEARTMVVRAREILRKVLGGMEPLTQLALLVSLDRLPPGRARDAFQAAAVELAATFSTTGGSTEGSVASLLRSLAQQHHDASLIHERLSAMAVSREQLDEVLSILTWERLSLDERVEKLTAGDQALNMTPEKLVQFIAELLGQRRFAEVLRILEHYVAGASHSSLFVRHNVSETLSRVALFIKSPRLPRQIEQVLGAAILNHFVREKELQMSGAVARAAANLIVMLAATGRCEPALRVVQQLRGAAAASPPASTLRRSSSALDAALGDPALAGELIATIVSADPETLAQSVLPLVEELGAIMAPHAIEALEHEEDRIRRGRLVKALKAIGEPAFPGLVSALNAHVWYVVRNALNVLGDVGTPAQVPAIGRTLRHDDSRVRRAAARALSRVGGDDAASLLAAAIQDRDRETQNEIFLCLGAMKAESAVPSLLEFVKSRRLGTDDALRELAINTLGQIGSEAAVPALGDILRSRGLLGREAGSIRLAAANALGRINTKAARAVLQSALAAESDRAMRQVISNLCERSPAQATA